MEKKTQRKQERELLLKLYGAVNSQEELDWVKCELALLDAEEAIEAGRCVMMPEQIDTVAFAERSRGKFLSTPCKEFFRLVRVCGRMAFTFGSLRMEPSLKVTQQAGGVLASSHGEKQEWAVQQ